MTFPAEAVPDNAVFAPHHLSIGVLAAMMLLAIVWNDRGGAEPAVAAAALLAALFSFWYVWPFYPVTGALGVLAGLLVASLAFGRPLWRDYSLGIQVGYALCILIALDDAVSHAFGVWTPLDWFFHAFLLWFLR